MSARDHSGYQEDIGAYLLGALTELEIQAFERHMAGCPECRGEVERLRPAANALPRSVEQRRPPASLKASLMDVIESEAQEVTEERPERAAGPSLGRRLSALFASVRPILVAGVLLLGLAGGYGIAQLAGGPGTRTVVAEIDQMRVPAASARLQVQGDGENGAILRVQGMPSLDSNQVYQAWVQRDGTIVPQPTFEVGEDGGGAVAIPEDVSDADKVMVTREPRGGARAPGELPIVIANL